MGKRSISPNATGDSVRWLDADERAAWLKLLALSMRLPAALDAGLQRDAGLTLFEYSVLAVLSEQPDGKVRMSQLAALAQGSLSRLSHVVTKMEKKGLVVRRPCPSDGRFTNAVLTDLGHARIVAAAPRHVATARELVIDAMSRRQLAQLRQSAELILARIDPGGQWIDTV